EEVAQIGFRIVVFTMRLRSVDLDVRGYVDGDVDGRPLADVDLVWEACFALATEHCRRVVLTFEQRKNAKTIGPCYSCRDAFCPGGTRAPARLARCRLGGFGGVIDFYLRPDKGHRQYLVGCPEDVNSQDTCFLAHLILLSGWSDCGIGVGGRPDPTGAGSRSSARSRSSWRARSLAPRTSAGGRVVRSRPPVKGGR